ncbi:MAG TPA: N-acetyl-gamma-glutamyl-phosphate reductase [Desulfatirhabdiaceae bacterium]|nr:N-acetyl-gamma-glutamyl-phosphate reductase [Desulfatirhabdiaceae bacterium]
MIRAGVIGATGYAGAELVRILAGHPNIQLSLLTSRQFAGTRFDSVYPSMMGHVNLVCQEYSLNRVCEAVDVVFTALPHQLPMTYVPEFIRNGLSVIDLSADFRFKNQSTYETWYQPHSAAEFLSQAVYGLTEIYRDDIRQAKLIGNPGCYPTSVLLPLIPLLKNKLIAPDDIIADSKSGVSGAGRSPALGSLYCEVDESFKAYKVGKHRHNPEMDEILSRESGKNVGITFIPHLVPMNRGMLSTIYARPLAGVSATDIRDCLKQFYDNCPFIRLMPENRVPDTRWVRGTNFCDIGFHLDASKNRLILISAIDNLVKGAAGQAVQNMNIMQGFSETAGLDSVPFAI